MPSRSAELPFAKIIQALLDERKPFPARYIYRLSDLDGEDRLALERAWLQVPLRRRQALLEDIRDMGEDDFLLDFTSLGTLVLKDPDALVRALMVETLAEYQSRELLSDFLHLAENDQDATVRAAAARALGAFVYMGEVDELPAKAFHKVEECLLRIMRGNDVAQVRRRALEALGYSSRDEVPALIEAAYYSGDQDWLASALFAMGRSSNPAWADKVIESLDDHNPAVRAEAASAAGELGLRASVDSLLGLLNDDDEAVRAAAIWSLSEIGGQGVRQALEELLENTDDDDEAEWIEDALENLAFVEESDVFTLIELEEEALDEADLLDEDDLEDTD